MKIEKIRPIPQKILAKIKSADKRINPKPNGNTRYYAYLTTNDRELVKVTVAVKHWKKEWYYKQCAVHGLHSERCFLKDMVFNYIGGYSVGWYAEGLSKRMHWYEGSEWGWNADSLFNPYAHLINAEYVYKFPEFKYSACELYKGDDIIKYLRTYEKYPQAEYLVKLGLSRYTDSKQILEKIAEDKRFRKYLSVNRSELENPSYYISTILSAYKNNKPLNEIQAYEEAVKKLRNDRNLKPIRDMLNGDYKPYFDYIGKQNITNRLYLDYLTACNFLGLDMTEAKNRYPHDFKRWHDIRIDEYHTAKALKDEADRKELCDKFKAIAEKYLPLTNVNNSGYIAIISMSPSELAKEGEALHHCVGRMGYDQKFVREESLIFFIRSAEDTETPLATVEYSIAKKKILQCYADHNSKPNENVMHFVNDIWLPYANKTLKKIAA